MAALRGDGEREIIYGFDMTDRTAEITVPCLILHGDQDIVSPLDPCGLGLDSGLKDSRLVVFEGANHCPAVEAPDRATALIREFVRCICHPIRQLNWLRPAPCSGK